ncbi:hypothetical protein AB1Y20_015522 [Prymnesium parvum]|uniref:Tetratricopeptide repeat protein 38 n=1 Tax=Prymnesium parvum TaxID=97485 RepID=A0AB34JY49_PRYPA
MESLRLGSSHHPIHTQSPEAQSWFDRGFAWLGAYHREEAALCFEKASAADPGCAMAQWGIALAHGPDYNFHAGNGFLGVAAQPSGWPSLHVATRAVGKAAELAVGGPARESALIGALAVRYEWPPTEESAALDEQYAERMEEVALAFPDDADVQAVAAEAIVILRPWDLYVKPCGSATPPWNAADKELRPVGARAAALVERGLRACPSHMWLCHLKIHLCEMGPIEHFDWQSAELVRGTDAVDCGHLVHMPSHLDIQVGDYQRAMEGNVLAYQADLRLHALSPERFTIYTGYVVHNMEFCAWAAMYAGAKAVALEASKKIDSFFSHEVITATPITAMCFEAYLTTRLMVLIRFGLWEDILREPFKEDRQLYLSHTLILHYARGIAFGARSLLDAAKAEQVAFREMLTKLQPGDRLKHNVNLKHMADIGEPILAAELHYREGDFESAFDALSKAVALFDALPYDEPHGWLMSPRQTFGALLAEQQQYDRAISIFDEDLVLFPKNPWSLAGLKICLSKTGSPRLEDVQAALEQASKLADVRIGTSCACALSQWTQVGC